MRWAELCPGSTQKLAVWAESHKEALEIRRRRGKGPRAGRRLVLFISSVGAWRAGSRSPRHDVWPAGCEKELGLLLGTPAYDACLISEQKRERGPGGIPASPCVRGGGNALCLRTVGNSGGPVPEMGKTARGETEGTFDCLKRLCPTRRAESPARCRGTRVLLSTRAQGPQRAHEGRALGLKE